MPQLTPQATCRSCGDTSRDRRPAAGGAGDAIRSAPEPAHLRGREPPARRRRLGRYPRRAVRPVGWRPVHGRGLPGAAQRGRPVDLLPRTSTGPRSPAIRGSTTPAGPANMRASGTGSGITCTWRTSPRSRWVSSAPHRPRDVDPIRLHEPMKYTGHRSERDVLRLPVVEPGGGDAPAASSGTTEPPCAPARRSIPQPC
jgi:hypothetical protein